MRAHWMSTFALLVGYAHSKTHDTHFIRKLGSFTVLSMTKKGTSIPTNYIFPHYAPFTVCKTIAISRTLEKHLKIRSFDIFTSNTKIYNTDDLSFVDLVKDNIMQTKGIASLFRRFGWGSRNVHLWTTTNTLNYRRSIAGYQKMKNYFDHSASKSIDLPDLLRSQDILCSQSGVEEIDGPFLRELTNHRGIYVGDVMSHLQHDIDLGGRICDMPTKMTDMMLDWIISIEQTYVLFEYPIEVRGKDFDSPYFLWDSHMTRVMLAHMLQQFHRELNYDSESNTQFYSHYDQHQLLSHDQQIFFAYTLLRYLKIDNEVNDEIGKKYLKIFKETLLISDNLKILTSQSGKESSVDTLSTSSEVKAPQPYNPQNSYEIDEHHSVKCASNDWSLVISEKEQINIVIQIFKDYMKGTRIERSINMKFLGEIDLLLGFETFNIVFECKRSTLPCLRKKGRQQVRKYANIVAILSSKRTIGVLYTPYGLELVSDFGPPQYLGSILDVLKHAYNADNLRELSSGILDSQSGESNSKQHAPSASIPNTMGMVSTDTLGKMGSESNFQLQSKTSNDQFLQDQFNGKPVKRQASKPPTNNVQKKPKKFSKPPMNKSSFGM